MNRKEIYRIVYYVAQNVTEKGVLEIRGEYTLGEDYDIPEQNRNDIVDKIEKQDSNFVISFKEGYEHIISQNDYRQHYTRPV